LQVIAEDIDRNLLTELALDSDFTSLPKLRNLFGIYMEILPQVILVYQENGKSILEEHGYASRVEDPYLQEYIENYRESYREYRL
jgi:hypothetical protein